MCPLEGRTPCLAYPACTGLRDRGTRPSAGGEDGCNYDDDFYNYDDDDDCI